MPLCGPPKRNRTWAAGGPTILLDNRESRPLRNPPASFVWRNRLAPCPPGPATPYRLDGWSERSRLSPSQGWESLWIRRLKVVNWCSDSSKPQIRRASAPLQAVDECVGVRKVQDKRNDVGTPEGLKGKAWLVSRGFPSWRWNRSVASRCWKTCSCSARHPCIGNPHVSTLGGATRR